MKSNKSSQSLRKRMRELKKVSTRIEAKMVKLEKKITRMTRSP